MTIVLHSFPAQTFFVQGRFPECVKNGVWVLCVPHNFVNDECNTRTVTRVLVEKCNDKGVSFFKKPVGVRTRDLTH